MKKVLHIACAHQSEAVTASWLLLCAFMVLNRSIHFLLFIRPLNASIGVLHCITYMRYNLSDVNIIFYIFITSIHSINCRFFSERPNFVHLKSLTLIESPLARTCGALASFVMFCKFCKQRVQIDWLVHH